MSSILALDVPYPPSVNRYWRAFRGRNILSAEARAYRRAITAVMLERKLTPLSGRLAVSVMLCPPDRRRRDLDNAMKGLLDGLQHGGAYTDDSQIDKLTIERGAVTPRGLAIVDITEREQP